MSRNEFPQSLIPSVDVAQIRTPSPAEVNAARALLIAVRAERQAKLNETDRQASIAEWMAIREAVLAARRQLAEVQK